MARSIVPGAIFAFLIAVTIVGVAILPDAPATFGIMASQIIGLVWFFALWGALVAGVIFIIAWGAEGFTDFAAPADMGEPLSLGRRSSDQPRQTRSGQSRAS